MTTCDLCGTSKGPFYNAKLEGSAIRVCTHCKSYAKEAWLIKETLPEEPKNQPQRPQQAKQRTQAQPERGELVQVIVDDYGDRIKKARERQQLKQAVLAKRLAVKESELHTWESSRRKPRIDMARKLEKALHIQLVEQQELKPLSENKKASGPLTIADLINRR
ncbi:TIGR00270 family protein [Candidatus Woesearchaeota archaeon]|nr:TIGR00270 family protein [Candidatus Woesearchaeota archaeon]